MRPILVFFLLALPLSAQAFTARNGMQAGQVGPTEIGVLFEPGRSDTDYWCAAGDFAQRELGYSNSTRIWRASAKPRRAGQGIVFTLDSTKQAEGAGISQFGSGPHDGSISVGMAVGSHCQMIIPYWND